MPPLVTTGELLDVPAAAGLSGRELEMAGEAVRGECGWHIAPVATHTVLVSGGGSRRLVLPTRALGQVESVTDATSPQTVHTGWREVPGPMLLRERGWPTGDHNIAVTMTHGYDRCPADLLAVVLEHARLLHDPPTPGVRQESRTSGDVSRSRTYTESAPAWSLAAAAILDRYRV